MGGWVFVSATKGPRAILNKNTKSSDPSDSISRKKKKRLPSARHQRPCSPVRVIRVLLPSLNNCHDQNRNSHPEQPWAKFSTTEPLIV